MARAAVEGLRDSSSQLHVNGDEKTTGRPGPSRQSSLASFASNGIHARPDLDASRAIVPTDFASADSPVHRTGRRFSMQSWASLTQEPNRREGWAGRKDSTDCDSSSSKHWRGHDGSSLRHSERSAGGRRSGTRPAAPSPGRKQGSRAASSGGSMEGAAILGMRASRGGRPGGRSAGSRAATRAEDRVQSASAVPRVQSAAHGRRVNPKIRLELRLDPDEERRRDDRAARPHTVSLFH